MSVAFGTVSLRVSRKESIHVRCPPPLQWALSLTGYIVLFWRMSGHFRAKSGPSFAGLWPRSRQKPAAKQLYSHTLKELQEKMKLGEQISVALGSDTNQGVLSRASDCQGSRLNDHKSTLHTPQGSQPHLHHIPPKTPFDRLSFAYPLTSEPHFIRSHSPVPSRACTLSPKG
ncbi:unnamed protein product [Protopolystoma xenopodis]|uniref:Uncharacterized protein n=1 Tax=Protopolystoma xenopodis TaxID=117903 RepID=A0A448X5Q5_9PLAT|nr:unnamed protein product [Protopolystoma xenopodis]